MPSARYIEAGKRYLNHVVALPDEVTPVEGDVVANVAWGKRAHISQEVSRGIRVTG